MNELKKASVKKINARVLKGFRDYLPEDAALREQIIDRIKKVFKRFGFVPLETPSLEYEDVLSGKYGEEGSKLMYKFTDRGGRKVALRYDLTVPLSRVISQYQDKINLPFKRYQIAQVWRAENPQRGRLREFTQCDVDILGTTSLLAEAELIALIDSVLNELGLDKFIVLLNTRKLLDGIFKYFNVTERDSLEVLRSIDKLEKISVNKVKENLTRLLGENRTEEILSIINFRGCVDELKKNLGDRYDNVLINDGLRDLAQIETYLQQLKVDAKRYKIDLRVVRGLDYYTGTVIETRLIDYVELGSIFSGGRYDKLIGLFTNNDIPAVGVSLGLDRLLSIKEKLGIDKFLGGSGKNALVINFEDTQKESLLLTNKLRKLGVNCDFYYEPKKLDKQLKHAFNKGTKFILFLGSKEVKGGVVRVKDLDSGEEKLIKQGEIEQFILNNSFQAAKDT